MKGTICVNDVLLLGPNTLGQFFPAAIKSIHRKRLPVGDVRSGQTASFALKKVIYSNIINNFVFSIRKFDLNRFVVLNFAKEWL